MMPRKMSVVAPRCSSTCDMRISSAELSSKGQGRISRSARMSGAKVSYLSTLTKPACLFWPQPRLSFIAGDPRRASAAGATVDELLEGAANIGDDAFPGAVRALAEDAHARVPRAVG